MDERLTDLEVKLSFAEHLLDELNRMVYRQQLQIERLENELRQVRQQMNQMQPAEARSLRDEIPPHY
ncbi:MAG: Protein SlyX [Pseudomonadota bacterium]|jgi:SlyX protein